MTETAYAVGYNPLPAFNAAFLDITGQTPSAYSAQVRTAWLSVSPAGTAAEV
ncbi:MAG TPA: hypothetical protein VGN60_12915 [Devosia sp.]|nr:hypothetical protein [Devosia sp.]